MSTQEQGEDYIEEESTEQPSKGLNVNPKIIVCVIVIVVILGLVLSVSLFFNRNKSEAESVAESLDVYESLADLPLPNLDVGSETVTIETTAEFSDKTSDILRKWGYTNNQLEIAKRDGLSAEQLVEAAKKERAEAQWEALQSVMDSTTPEYQHLASTTWVGQQPLDVSGFDSSKTYLSNEVTVNIDYEKIEPRGSQLWLKCYLGESDYVFMPVTPMRYNQLDESGNIVIKYTYIEENGTRVILSIEEVKV